MKFDTLSRGSVDGVTAKASKPLSEWCEHCPVKSTGCIPISLKSKRSIKIH